MTPYEELKMLVAAGRYTYRELLFALRGIGERWEMDATDHELFSVN
jgi:hypothetical protein